MTDKTIPTALPPGTDQVEATRKLSRETEDTTNGIIDQQVKNGIAITPNR